MTASTASARTYRLGLLVGDGIGPEIAPAAVRVIDAALTAVASPVIEWRELPMGRAAIASHGTALPEETVAALEELDGWVLGPIDPVGYPEPFRSQLAPSGALRKHFDLYANVRPVRALSSGRVVVPGLDLVIVRENTEGFYADRNTFAGTGEYMPTPDVAIAMGVITRAGVERIAVAAFELARRRRERLTIVHKANVLRLSMGLFRDVCREVGERYPDVVVDDFHIDAMTVHLVRSGSDFDVLVAENMFGDILSDLTGELAGSLGIAPSLNASDSRAMAQAAHGSAPDIAGRDVANPIAMILSGGMLLDWLGTRHGDGRLSAAAERIDDVVRRVVDSGVRTRDLGGTASTSSFTSAVVADLLG